MLSKKFHHKEQLEFLVERLILATTEQSEDEYTDYYIRLKLLVREALENGFADGQHYLALADFTWKESEKFHYYHEALKHSNIESDFLDQLHLSMGLSHFHYGKKDLAKLHLERSHYVACRQGHTEMAERALNSMRALKL